MKKQIKSIEVAGHKCLPRTVLRNQMWKIPYRPKSPIISRTTFLMFFYPNKYSNKFK